MAYFITNGSSKLEGQQLTRTREEKLILIKHECWSDSDMLCSSYLREVNTDNLKQQVYGKVMEVQYAVWAKEWRKGTIIFLWIDDIMQVVCRVAMGHEWVRVCNLCPPVSVLLLFHVPFMPDPPGSNTNDQRPWLPFPESFRPCMSQLTRLVSASLGPS